MRAFFAVLVFTFVLVPHPGYAAAGFAPTSFFASKTSSTAGDTISLFSVLYNESNATLTGDVVFMIDGTSIGSKSFSLTAGETQTPSLSWKAVAGTHTASARLENVAGGGSATPGLNDKTGTITLTVAPAPPPSASAQAVTNVTNIISSGVQSATPAARGALSSLEDLRQSVVHTLETQLAASSPHIGAVLGTSTSDIQTSGKAAGGIFASLWHYMLQGLLFVFSSKLLFYIALIFVAYVLFKIVRAIFSQRRL